ncbi:SDR family oxidoreductase [Micromonospora sp. WMMD1128]|uniref:SDR family oxidoreductase n=1 Tax=unclassified Micromonospora TaxID=2617518 RepID=UPI00248B2E86|nr:MULTISPECIES: SDR family oxidoreductase [unclassified Micromonospora]WBB75755.1 SDR family oxidoreductase [Micromonospora sp. WMMD1128]WFE36455.1 SDR family oxidoreductase [Micromonospora sp. WMMD975]
MQDSFEGRTAVVTGASRGIGLAVARHWHDRGGNVVLTARTAEAAEAAAATLGDRAFGFGAHVTSEERARACLEATLARFGRIDVLVNNAGTNPAFGPLVEQDHGRFTKLVDVNLWGPLLWTSLAWRLWMRDNGGAIVNVASLGGLSVSPDLGLYHVSKAALIHLTRQMALELAPGVRVNAVAPGVVRTRLAEALWKENETGVNAATPLGRIGEPHDVAELVAFLASGAASWITGETVLVDGGQLLTGTAVEPVGA